MLKMSSEEEFSIVSEDDYESNLKKIQKDIEKLKEEHAALQEDKKLLIDDTRNNIEFTQKFQQRTVMVKKRMEEEEVKQKEMLMKEKKKLGIMKEEELKLEMEIEQIRQKINQMEETNHSLKQQTEVSTAVPEKKVVFNGETAEGTQPLNFDVKSRIVYPMEGGTAFITFEDEEVAEKILALKDHVVQIGERAGDCSITVQAEPVQFLVPASVEMDTQVCPRRILVSNLPKQEDTDRILDKLEIYFSKKKNRGGEVEDVVMLEDSGNVVITFVESNIAKDLTDKQIHEIDMGKRHKVKVTPFLNGEITLLKTSNTTCCKTVLLTGIPNIMDRDGMQDMLEIHFQKVSNSGGEVDAIVYNPLGERTLAVFELDTPENKNL